MIAKRHSGNTWLDTARTIPDKSRGCSAASQLLQRRIVPGATDY